MVMWRIGAALMAVIQELTQTWSQSQNTWKSIAQPNEKSSGLNRKPEYQPRPPAIGGKKHTELFIMNTLLL